MKAALVAIWFEPSRVVLQVRFIQFTAAGDPLSLKGDYFAGKGIGWAQLETPVGIVDTFNTHLSANYKQSWQGELPCLLGLVPLLCCCTMAYQMLSIQFVSPDPEDVCMVKHC